MGMFDYITEVPEIRCVKCGKPVTGWQSKDYFCTMARIPFWYVEHFYTSCRGCGQWHSFDAKTPPPERPFSDYESTTLVVEEIK